MLERTEVKPFRGLRYDPDRISSLSNVITPPYDVITPDAQNHFHEKDPYSSIRLDFGHGSDDPRVEGNRYVRAAARLDEWLEAGVLKPDAKPAYYWCREEFRTPDGNAAVREGFFAALGLVDFSHGAVLPHEYTSPGPKADRMALMSATEANLSPIFCLYPDPERELDGLLADHLSRDPDAEATDEAGTRHSLWVIDDDETVDGISSFMAGQRLMIADGHHRYETALAYRDERRGRDGSSEPQPYDYMMTYLSSGDADDMTILPLHRLISGLTTETLAALPAALEEMFEVEPVSMEEGIDTLLGKMAGRGAERNAFGMHIAGSDNFYLLVARQPRPIIPETAGQPSASWRSLDVAVLDRIILAQVLDIQPGSANEDASVRFVERAETSPEEFAKAEHQVMILLNPTTMEEVRAVSEAGEKMPRKSTYFYPKPVTGLVFRSLRY
ncbi:MAG: DUF1015 domain-containing protein [Gaiellales bacterium]|nr:MAG: DUF1015 domain-containing protein [Gaiellales bacterium]